MWKLCKVYLFYFHFYWRITLDLLIIHSAFLLIAELCNTLVDCLATLPLGKLCSAHHIHALCGVKVPGSHLSIYHDNYTYFVYVPPLSSIILGSCKVYFWEPRSIKTSPIGPRLQKVCAIELLSDMGTLISSTFLIILDTQSILWALWVHWTGLTNGFSNLKSRIHCGMTLPLALWYFLPSSAMTVRAWRSTSHVGFQVPPYQHVSIISPYLWPGFNSYIPGMCSYIYKFSLIQWVSAPWASGLRTQSSASSPDPCWPTPLGPASPPACHAFLPLGRLGLLVM